MIEILELRINYDYAHLLFKRDEGRDLGQFSKSIKIVELSKDDPRYNQIPIISKRVKEKYDEGFFFGWQIKRKYSKKEFEKAKLLQMKIKAMFEPAGEECETIYDETMACEICGANRTQISLLTLKKNSIPKKDIARTIAGEVVVSEKFVEVFKQRGLKGAVLEPVVFNKGASGCYQLIASSELDLTRNTVAGVNPFDFSEGSEGVEFTLSGGYPVKFEKEIYKCPKGHTIGLNLLSEAYVLDSPSIKKYDFFASKQKIGVRRGLLRPEPIYLCSQKFRQMVIEEKLTGFEFEVAHIE
ncbi:MAG: hypothetical protein ACK5L5_11145 [Bacteroidales bacterium]